MRAMYLMMSLQQGEPYAGWADPVSYTHLEVYKRQDYYNDTKNKREIVFFGEEGACLLYTSRCV